MTESNIDWGNAVMTANAEGRTAKAFVWNGCLKIQTTNRAGKCTISPSYYLAPDGERFDKESGLLRYIQGGRK